MNIEYNFWNRVDLLRKNSKIKTLKDLAKATGIKEKKFKDQRSNQSLPKALDLLAIAKAYDVSIEFLLTGEVEASYPPRIKRIADKLCKISELDLYVIERNVELLPVQEKSEKVNVG